jgi:ATP-dependent Clp protease ATP-binding subunit ClpC
VNEALKAHFRPEFLNRIDDTIVFHELSKPEVVEIVDLMLTRLVKQLAAQGIGLEMTGAAKLLLADRGYDPTMGARPLRRALQQLVEDPLSEKLLFREFGAGQTVVVDAVQDPETGDEVIVFVKQDGYEPPALNEDPVPLTL